MKKVLLLTTVLLIGATTAWAGNIQVTPHPASETVKVAASTAQPLPNLAEQDQTDIARIEAYLNALRSVSADFLQVDDQGGVMRGTIAIQRPGKMRATYEAPSKDFIVADGDTVHIWNEDLKAQTNIDQDSNLAEFILRDPIKLSGDVTITKLEHFPGKIEVTLVETADPANGKLTLVFEDHPLQLRQWKVLDTQGRTIGINLENMREDVEFPSSTFTFVPPNFGKNSRVR